jgi:hypothetical protein
MMQVMKRQARISKADASAGSGAGETLCLLVRLLARQAAQECAAEQAALARDDNQRGPEDHEERT